MASAFVHFLGASGTVTGSKYLIETGYYTFMVDCGLFQGLKELRRFNRIYLPADLKQLKAVLLTHGHLDHVGYLPCLLHQGFNGKVYGTEPTLEIASLILRDSAKIQEEEAEQANRLGYSRHRPAQALYTSEDVEKIITRFVPVNTHTPLALHENLEVLFFPNGHIPGSCYLEVRLGKKILIFSGDLGREDDVLMKGPEKPETADILFLESTYGDRLHPKEEVSGRIRDLIIQTVGRGGSLIIPGFAVEKTQALMYLHWQLKKRNEIPDIPFILDSPMSIGVLEVFSKYTSWHRLSVNDCLEMCAAFRMIKDIRETHQMIHTPYPKIIIAGSGMITGGRVLHYLQHYLSHPSHTLLLTGYQAEGTRGRKILDGAHEVKIFGKYYPVKLQVEMLHHLSAHADQKGLLNWLGNIKKQPEKIYLVHGERQPAETLLVKIRDVLGWKASVPSLFQIDEWKSG